MDSTPNTELRHMLCGLVAALRDVADRMEIVADVLAVMDERVRIPLPQNGLMIDREHLTVSWNGRRCHMGYTIPFRLLERLARRPNQYVTHERLLHDIWGGSRSKSALRSAINNLRIQLVAAGMADLAKAIDGRNAGRYGLMLDGRR